MMRRLAAILHLTLAACGPGEGEIPGTDSTTRSSTSGDPTDAGPPSAPCNDNDDCPDRCLDGQCVQGCSPELPCPQGLDCVEDACIAPVPSPPLCAVTASLLPFLELELPGGPGTAMVGAADADGDGTRELFAEHDGLWLTRLDNLAPTKIYMGAMQGAFETNVGDINGDGLLDILPREGHDVLFGAGASTFQEFPGPDPALHDGALGDLDADGRADLVGFRFECPLDAPPESECYGWNPARWMRGDDAWTVNFRATVYGEPRNVLVAPLLAGDTPVAVYESDLGWIVLDTVSEESWQYELYRVPRDDKPESSDMVAVRRVGDDRSELARVAARANRWTFGSRIRAVGEGANIPDRWALPGQYHHLAAGDLDQDGDDDLVLAGPKLLLMLDREEEPTGACLVEVPFADNVQDLAVADLDGDAAPELILGTAPGLVVYSLQWGP